jgi:hypothetical protein
MKIKTILKLMVISTLASCASTRAPESHKPIEFHDGTFQQNGQRLDKQRMTDVLTVEQNLTADELQDLREADAADLTGNVITGAGFAILTGSVLYSLSTLCIMCESAAPQIPAALGLGLPVAMIFIGAAIYGDQETILKRAVDRHNQRFQGRSSTKTSNNRGTIKERRRLQLVPDYNYDRDGKSVYKLRLAVKF